MFSLKKLFHKEHNHYGKTERSSYLSNHGWYISLERHKERTADHRSAILLPYSLSDLLAERLKREMTAYVRWNMQSYRWLLHKVHHVTSDHVSMHRVGDSRRGRFERQEELDDTQSKEYIASHKERFQFMLLDGPGKLAELESTLTMLAPEGVMAVVDDTSDPYEMNQIQEKMKAKGFRALPFRNPAPLYHDLLAVLYYRDNNSLEI